MRSPVQRNAQSAFGATDREAPSETKLETERTKPTELADQVDNLLTKRGTSLQITTNMGAVLSDENKAVAKNIGNGVSGPKQRCTTCPAELVKK